MEVRLTEGRGRFIPAGLRTHDNVHSARIGVSESRHANCVGLPRAALGGRTDAPHEEQ